MKVVTLDVHEYDPLSPVTLLFHWLLTRGLGRVRGVMDGLLLPTRNCGCCVSVRLETHKTKVLLYQCPVSCRDILLLVFSDPHTSPNDFTGLSVAPTTVSSQTGVGGDVSAVNNRVYEGLSFTSQWSLATVSDYQVVECR